MRENAQIDIIRDKLIRKRLIAFRKGPYSGIYLYVSLSLLLEHRPSAVCLNSFV